LELANVSAAVPARSVALAARAVQRRHVRHTSIAYTSLATSTAGTEMNGSVTLQPSDQPLSSSMSIALVLHVISAMSATRK